MAIHVTLPVNNSANHQGRSVERCRSLTLLDGLPAFGHTSSACSTAPNPRARQVVLNTDSVRRDRFQLFWWSTCSEERQRSSLAAMAPLAAPKMAVRDDSFSSQLPISFFDLPPSSAGAPENWNRRGSSHSVLPYAPLQCMASATPRAPTQRAASASRRTIAYKAWAGFGVAAVAMPSTRYGLLPGHRKGIRHHAKQHFMQSGVSFRRQSGGHAWGLLRWLGSSCSHSSRTRLVPQYVRGGRRGADMREEAPVDYCTLPL